jgi:hypothetical protein
LAELRDARNAVVHYANVATVALGTARSSARRDDIQPTYDSAALIYGAENAAAGELLKVETLSTSLLQSVPDLKAQIETLRSEAREAGKSIEKSKKAVDELIDGLPRDPPIDGLSHSVRFVVAVNGNLSPNWSLVHFRGGGSLSASHTRTHTLSIAMGLPGEQARILNNLVIIQNLRPTQ